MASPAGSPAALEPLATLAPANLRGSPAWSASFSLDGRYLAVCWGNPDTHVKVWEQRGEGAEWTLLGTIREEHTRTIRAVAFAPTPSTLGVPILASASFDGKVMIWEHYPDGDEGDEGADGADGEASCFDAIAQLEGHESEVKGLAWNAAGSLLASCGRDKTVWLWECFLPGTVGGSEAQHPDADGGEQGDFECLAVLQGHEGDVKAIRFGPSHGQWGEGEEVLYSASYDDTIKVWAEEAGDWYCAATLGGDGAGLPSPVPPSDPPGPVHTSTVWSLGLAPGGVRLFSGSDDGSVAVWKMYTAAERRRRFPDSAAAAVCSTDGLWRPVGRLPDAHATYAVLSLDCAPSRAGHGRLASGGGDDGIHVYREEAAAAGGAVGGGSDAPQFALEAAAAGAHAGDVNCVRWHPRDGTRLVSCGDDGAVRLWRYRRG